MNDRTYTPDLPIAECCSQRGCDLDDDRHGEMCKECWIWEGAYDAADAKYDSMVEG